MLDFSSGCDTTGRARGSGVGGSATGVAGAARGVAGDSKGTVASLGVDASSSFVSDTGSGSGAEDGVGVDSTFGDEGAKSVAGGCAVIGASSLLEGAGANGSVGVSSG